MSPIDARKILEAVGRVRRRLRAQAILRWSLRFGAVAALVVIVGVLLFSAWLVLPDTMPWIMWTAAGLVVIGIAFGLFQPFDSGLLAQRLDRANDLKDRLSTALELLAIDPDKRTEFEDTQIRDALSRADSAAYGPAAPWRFPMESLAVIGLIAIAWGVTFVKMAPPAAEYDGLTPIYLVNAVPPPERLTAGLDNVMPDAEGYELLKERIADNSKTLDPLALGDPEATKFIEKLNKTLQQLAEGKLTDRDIAKTAQQLDEQLEALVGDPKEQRESEAFADKLEDVGKALKKQSKKIRQKDLEELGKLLEQGKFEEAARKLEKLMELFKKLSPKQQQKLAKMFEKLAKKFQSKLAKKLDKMRKQRSRLQKKQQEQGELSKREKRRLDRLNKDLERLDRRYSDGNKKAPGRKQLDRLSRDLRDMADKMRRRDKTKGQRQQRGSKRGPEGRSQRMDRETMRRLSEAMRKAGKTRRRQRLARMGKMRVADLKEMLRRRQGRGQRSRKQLDRLARGKKGQKGSGGLAMGKGDGKSRSGVEWMRLDKSMSRQDRLRMGKARLGEGAGHGRGRALQGRATDIRGAKIKDDFAAGQKGKGPTRREILLGAAQEGTRVRGYGQAHIDYTTKAAEQMTKEKIPPGYRTYVEQYFELIRAR